MKHYDSYIRNLAKSSSPEFDIFRPLHRRFGAYDRIGVHGYGTPKDDAHAVEYHSSAAAVPVVEIRQGRLTDAAENVFHHGHGTQFPIFPVPHHHHHHH